MMDDLRVIEEGIDRILQSLDQQIRGIEQTLVNLKNLLSPLDESRRGKCLDYLFNLLVKRVRGRYSPDHNSLQIQRVAVGILFRVLFEFGRVEMTLCKIIGFLDVDSPDVTNNWINCVSQEITSAVYTYSVVLSQEALDTLRGHAALFSHPGTDLARAMPAFSPYVMQLNRAIENAEFSRFEKQLRGVQVMPAPDAGGEQAGAATVHPVAAAMKEAGEYLRSDGIFNPKKAADLMRTSIDESHREVVNRLVTVTGTQCINANKDGARRAYLRKIGFISEPEERFFSAIYTLLSEEASHKLIAPRETMLVMEQTVHNYLSLLNRRLSSFASTQSTSNP
jgi:hypothetical protein